jgi:dTDP-D-glucose 4,6-dehydratase
VSRLKNMGWTYDTDLKDGLKKLYQWYVNKI